MNIRTLKRRATHRINTRFQLRMEQEVRRTFELTLINVDVFGVRQPARRLLITPHPALDGVKPRDCGKSESGLASVRGMLVGLKYGRVVSEFHEATYTALKISRHASNTTYKESVDPFV